MRIDSAVRRAAADTASLADVFGENKADEVIATACARHERVVIERVIARLRALGKDEGLSPGLEGYTLCWFADELDRELAPDNGTYEPQDGDVVQVTLTGSIQAFDVSHPSMDEPDVMWELHSAEGILVPLSRADFDTLGVIQLA